MVFGSYYEHNFNFETGISEDSVIWDKYKDIKQILEKSNNK